MRTNRVIALVVATLVSTASFAGAQGASSGNARAARAQGRAAVQREGRDGLLRGLKLSDAEKAKVKEVQARYRTDAKAMRETMKPAMVEARAARQKGDSAAVRAVLERTKADREKARALRSEYVSSVRAALSAENQKAFDANVTQAKNKIEKRVRQGRQAGGKAARKAGRPQPRMRPNS